MNKIKIYLLASLASFFAINFSANAQDSFENSGYHLGFRVAPRISTLGVGLEAAKGFSPSFGVRAGFNYFSYGYDATESDISYDLELELKSFGVLADWHPFESAFRLSGGLLINGNGLTGNARPATPVRIGNADYSVDSVNLEISYNEIAPYFGLGWDTTFGDHDNWGFAFDLGLIYSGAPDAKLNVSGAVSADDVRREREDLQNELDSLKWWPVVSLGLVYQF